MKNAARLGVHSDSQR